MEKVQTAAGEEDQEAWSWGAGTDGQLATGSLQDEHCPQLVRSLSSVGPIASLSCGGAHVIAVAPGGRVVTWGRGSSGQLGHGEMVNSLQPKIVEALESVVITHVSAGWNHSGFVSENDAVFTCGDGAFGQLGHGDYSSQSSPMEVSYFASKAVERVACGMRHSLVLRRGNVENQVYAFGSGKRGQLGISTDRVKSINHPQITLGLTDLEIVDIKANGDHSAALSADGRLYTWGRGFGGASDAYIPRHIDAAFPIDDVALGWNHALLLTRGGKVFMLGGNRHGVLGDPQKTSLTRDVSGKSEESQMVIVPGFMETKVTQVAAGSEHSALITGKNLIYFSAGISTLLLEHHAPGLASNLRIFCLRNMSSTNNVGIAFDCEDDGLIMTWGWGEHGQLGLGDTDDRTAPQVVSLGHKLTEKQASSRVYCGSGFTFVLKT